MIVAEHSNSINVTARHLAAPEAYRLGQRDAQDGSPCLPELYFVRREQMVAYAHGYERVAGATLLSRQVLQEVER